MVKFRMEGTRDELADALECLDDSFIIHSTSRLYENRNDDNYRIYIEAEPRIPSLPNDMPLSLWRGE